MTQTTILYHANCVDGTAAAMAAWRTLGDHETRYIPHTYGKPAPKDIEPGTDLYLLDLTLPRAEILDLARTCGRVTILDHHASAQRALDGLTDEASRTPGACEIRTIFDLEHSACVLAWNYWNHGLDVPRLLTLIEDRDLWRFQWPESRRLHYALENKTISKLSELIDSKSALHCAIDDGIIIYEYLKQQFDAIAKRASPIMVLTIDNAQLTYTACHCHPGWSSDVGHLLLENKPAADVAVMYSDTFGDSGPDATHDRTTYSLRSRPAGPDVSLIAASFGGGGHPNSAGFTIKNDRSWFMSRIDTVLDAAKETLESVIVIGYEKDGSEYFASTLADG